MAREGLLLNIKDTRKSPCQIQQKIKNLPIAFLTVFIKKSIVVSLTELLQLFF